MYFTPDYWSLERALPIQLCDLGSLTAAYSLRTHRWWATAATLFVYGEPCDPVVRQVRVKSKGFTHLTSVDPDTGGYAVAIPEVTSANHVERAG